MVPKVSVIMPIYNVDVYLRECLESVKCQTLKDIEIICIDDGSTDGSPLILDEYAAADSRFRVIHNLNQGYGKSMNIGLSMARGNYIGVVETDDYIAPEMMEELYNIAVREEADVIKGDYYTFKSEGNEKKTQYISISDNQELYGKRIIPLENKDVFNARINTWAGIYRRKFLVDHNIRHNETPGASYQDNGFWFQVFTQAEKVFFVNKAYYYLRRDNPNSSINSIEKVYCICDEMRFIKEFMMHTPHVYDNYKDVYWLACFRKYRFNLKRIAPQYKLEFIQRMHEEFKSEFECIDSSRFTDAQIKSLNIIAKDPEFFYKEYVEMPEGIVRFCKMKESLILFGHGKRIRQIYRKCRFNGIVVNYVANLEDDNNAIDKTIQVVNIRSVKDKAPYTNVLIVDEAENRERLIEELEKLGFSNYMYYEVD